MKIMWHVEPGDIERVNRFVESQSSSPFVRRRVRTNVEREHEKASREQFWFRMVTCLLTTQQRSGPQSAVTRFISSQPFPLDYATCRVQGDLRGFAEQVMRDFGGLRRWTRIADELDTNLRRLESSLWDETLSVLLRLDVSDDARTERVAAEYVNRSFAGFGPKQSRNLLQSLGLTRFEIPVDSRITKWLNKFGFPLRLSAAALMDQNYYNLALDGIQELCRQCDVYPCILDAAIFASFDVGGWPEDGVIW